MQLLNLMYAPRRSRLYSLVKVGTRSPVLPLEYSFNLPSWATSRCSLVKTLSRIENLGFICAWAKASSGHAGADVDAEKDEKEREKEKKDKPDKKVLLDAKRKKEKKVDKKAAAAKKGDVGAAGAAAAAAAPGDGEEGDEDADEEGAEEARLKEERSFWRCALKSAYSPVPATGCPPIVSVELPRLKLTFAVRRDHMGVERLYSTDHADLFVTNERHPMVRLKTNFCFIHARRTQM